MEKELTIKNNNLPATIEKLAFERIVGREKLKAYRAKLRAVELIGVKEAKVSALEDTQDLADYLLDVDFRLGELLAAIEPKPKPDGSNRGTFGGREHSLPPGINKKVSHVAQTIAANPDAVEQAKAKARASGKIVTSDQVYKIIKTEEREEERKDLVTKIPKGKFAVICADPPWEYKNSGFDESAESQYPTMPTDEICEMKDTVNGFSTPETVLFLWATNPLLPDAMKVMESWGFEYKTNMAWIKDKGRGKGWFLKSKHELLLIGTRENTPHPKERPDSCFEADRGTTHSRKPQRAYEIIESMFNGARLEMFARKHREGWESHGNEL